MKSIKERIYSLLSIKSLVTLGLVSVFLGLCIAGREIPANLDTYVGLVIAFYFGTQHEKNNNKIQEEEEYEQSQKEE